MSVKPKTEILDKITEIENKLVQMADENDNDGESTKGKVEYLFAIVHALKWVINYPKNETLRMNSSWFG